MKTRKHPKYTLEELLEGMTEEHLHGEIEYGLAVGKETISEMEEDEFTLEELVAQITDENKHDYIDNGPAVGNEFT